MEGEELVSHQSGLVEMGKVAAMGHRHDPVAQEGIGLPSEARAQNPVLIPPEHADGLGRQGLTTAGKATRSGKGRQGVPPTWTLQVEGGDFQFRGSHTGVRIGKGAAAQSAPHPRQGEKTHPQGGQGQGKAAGHPPQTGRIEEEQSLHLLGPAAGKLQGYCSPHGGSDHAQGRGQPIEERLQMGQHPLRSIGPLFRPGGKAKSIEIRDHQGVGPGEQGCKAPELQKGAVEAVQQQKGRPLSGNNDGPPQRRILAQGRERPPLNLGCQGSAFRIQQRHGGPLNEGLGTGLLAHPTGWLWVVVVTRAASRSGGVTGKGR